MMSNRAPRWAALAAALTLAACGGASEQSTGAEGAPASGQAAAASAAPDAGGPQTPDAGGQVVTVEMLTDDQGNNIFRPADVSVKRGDVVRFTLVSGVHNVHFVADSNPGAQGLPSTPGDMLQLPGQTYDVKVTSGPGRYFYQCDPHALLGMVGHVTVQ